MGFALLLLISNSLMQTTSLQAQQLTKSFDDFVAVDHVSFQVHPGEIFGLIGPNGAGKTTTLRMLSGLLRPSNGTVLVNGIPMDKDKIQARRGLGFLTGDMDLYRRLTPTELLRYFGRLYRVPRKTLERRIDQLISLFGITEFATKNCETLSTGQKQRVSIARTQVHNPSSVILDEPTTGLDIMASEFVLQFINKVAKEENKAVIFSTHNLTEVERLCDRIGVIHKGQLLFLGTPTELCEQQAAQQLSEAFFNLVNRYSL